MKVATKTILAATVVLGIIAIPVILLIDRDKYSGDKPVAKIIQPELVVAGNGSWPMFRGGQGLSGRAEGTLPDSLELLWKFKTGGEVKSSPAIRLAGKPSIENGLVFVGSADANIYAIDLEKGHQVWADKTGDAIEAGPCVMNNTVFVGSLDNFLYALDAKSGGLKWKYQTGGKIVGAANWTPAARPSWPCLHGLEARATGLWILVGSYDNKLHCVNSTDGKVVWTYETASYVNGSPAVNEGKAIFGGCDAMIYIVSVVDGKMLTQIDAGSYIGASAAISNGRVYIGNYDSVFICGDIATGQVVWRYTGATSSILSSAAVDENVVVFGCRDKRVHCVSKDSGKVVWTFQTLGEIDSSPAIYGDKVVFGCGDGRLYMVRLSDGKQVWSYEIGQAVSSSPAIAGGIVVVGSDDGYVYAFGAKR